MIRIIADSHIPMLRNILEPFANIQYIPGEDIKNQNLAIIDALIIRTRTKCNSDLLKNSGIRLIASATIGTDHIDLDYCQNNGIIVRNAPGCNSASVCQYVMSALIGLSIKHGFSIKEKTLAVIGFGNVGTKVANFAKILGMNVLVNDPPKEKIDTENTYVSLNYIIHNADFISLHVPLTKSGQHKTYHLVDQQFLSQMSANQILINTSRGGVVDQDSLIKSLHKRKIAGAVLDVWKNEPDIDLELLDLADYGTAHIAGYSIDGKANGSAMVVNHICKYFNFDLENWYPENLAQPESTIINPQIYGRTDEEILKETLLKTYDIQPNDTNLRKYPERFESFRYNHPLRREYPVYKVNTDGMSDSLCWQLTKLGFKIQR